MQVKDRNALEQERRRVRRMRFLEGLREMVLFHQWKIAFLLLYAALWAGGWVFRRKLFTVPFLPAQITGLVNIAVDVLLVCLLVLGLVEITTAIGTPRRGKAVNNALLRIGLVNSAGEAPLLLAVRKEKLPHSHTTLYEFEQNGIPLSRWKSQTEKLGVALCRTVYKAEPSKNLKKIIVHTAPAETGLPNVLHWNNSHLSPESFVLNLGVSYAENVSVDLRKTPHILLGGSTGSGKSRLLKLLVWQALQKGAVVHIADFKGGVDYSPVWHEKCEICVEEHSLLDVLDKLLEELERRKGLFQKAGCADIDSYNRQSGEELQRHIFACDEAAELLDKTGRTKEEKARIEQIESALLATIARQGRAFGIHLFLATQRPDATILPGQIKNNMDFRVCGKADSVLSQIILDSTAAAEQIPKDSQGRFITNSGVVFQAYLLDDNELGCSGGDGSST